MYNMYIPAYILVTGCGGVVEVLGKHTYTCKGYIKTFGQNILHIIVSFRTMGALVCGLGADEPACTPLMTPLGLKSIACTEVKILYSIKLMVLYAVYFDQKFLWLHSCNIIIINWLATWYNRYKLSHSTVNVH